MVDLSHWQESPKRCCRCNRPVTAGLQGIDLQDYPAYLQVMDWDKLQYFLFVARHGTLARAGAALHVDATTVSRRVSTLEASLGQTLRSDEKTSEFQSLMRITYAVFRLKKKKQIIYTKD